MVKGEQKAMLNHNISAILYVRSNTEAQMAISESKKHYHHHNSNYQQGTYSRVKFPHVLPTEKIKNWEGGLKEKKRKEKDSW